MRTTYILMLCLLAATGSTAVAQEDTENADTMTDEVMEEVLAEDAMADEVIEEDMAEDAMADEVMEEDMAEDAMADEVMEEDMAEDAMADEVMEEETPSLEEVAASDPDLGVRVNDEGEVDAMVMLSDVLFSFGDASLNPAALDVLAGVANKLSEVPSLEITGHTDAIGDADFNLALGQRRADAVRDWLIANTEFSADAITARGVGEADPIAANRTESGADNPEGRAQNRRVEFTLPDAG
ncbi:OmpA family protein [Yoonia sp. GPGPB17]|uniref:OmpA family protein n=1 Tax=Yoonia sp. GPGPB17 TaxID=3026147 RepID=UPI0030BA600A